jgi:outer membrane protein assembly complex protein YaeT
MIRKSLHYRRVAAVLVAVALILFCGLAAAERDVEADAAAPVKPYEIRFEGNREFDEARLRKSAEEELADYERLGFRRADIDDAAYRMELAYRRAGHAFATVDYRITESPSGPVATFLISEGPRVVVEKITVTGNTAYSQEELRAFWQPQDRRLLEVASERVFVRTDFQDAAAEIADFYREQGYADVAVDSPEVTFSADRTRARVQVAIAEGPRYLIEVVRYEGDLPPETREAMGAVRQELLGKPYFPRRKFHLRSRVTEILADRGYADAVVTVADSPEWGPGAVALTAAIASGEPVVVGRVEIRGQDKTREEFIRSRIRILPGERYSLERERESFRELYRTGLFSAVRIELAGEGQPERPLVVEVTEAPSREVYLEPGWGSYEQLRLKLGFREKNLFGQGIIFGSEARASFKDQSLSGTLTDPWFLGTRTSASLGAHFQRREEPSFTREEIGANLLFGRKLTEHLSASAGYGLRTASLSEVDTQDTADGSEEQYNIGSLKAQLTYDTRDDYFFPTRGQRSFAAAEYASVALGGDIGFSRFTAGARFFFRLTPSTVLGLRYTTGLILPGAQEVSVPVAERFFNGGENTVRSFTESQLGPKDASGDPAGGLAHNVLNIELRQRLYGNFFGSVFFDAGNVAPNRSRAERGEPPYADRSEVLSDTFADFFSGVRMAVGAGLQYHTPVGPARIDFGVNPDRDSSRDEDLWAIHFSVGMAF